MMLPHNRRNKQTRSSERAAMEIKEVIWRDALGSTNTELAELARMGQIASGTVLAAHEQTAGRGRYERKWLTKAGENLTFSLCLQTPAVFPRVASVPMAAGLAVADLLREAYSLPALVKWPNDVMLHDRKISGILSENVAVTGYHGSTLIVGIGLNLNMDAESAALIDKPATSVRIETGARVEVEAALEALLPHIARRLTQWEEAGFAALREDYCARAWRIGQPVTIGDGENPRGGILLDFGADGEIILQLPDGRTLPCWSGDFAY